MRKSALRQDQLTLHYEAPSACPDSVVIRAHAYEVTYYTAVKCARLAVMVLDGKAAKRFASFFDAHPPSQLQYGVTALLASTAPLDQKTKSVSIVRRRD